MAVVDWMKTRANLVWENITVEPLAFLTTLIMALSGIAANDLYLQKACQVSLIFTNLIMNMRIYETVTIFNLATLSHTCVLVG